MRASIVSQVQQIWQRSAREQLNNLSSDLSDQPQRPAGQIRKRTNAGSSSEPQSASVVDHVITALTQYTIPHHVLPRLMYRLTRARWRPWKNWQIRWFLRRYGVDMSIAEESDALSHPDFNTFFTRALHRSARPIDPDPSAIVSPVDGMVSEAGVIDGDRLLQAKGVYYSLTSLLGGSEERAIPFRGGHFATLYLSPRDYHRIHMPLRGELEEMIYVPGDLFSVNPRTARTVPRLFARNERVITIFQTACGPMALVLVGAMFVANIETVWAGVVAPRGPREILTWSYRHRHADAPAIVLEKGEEMGRFNMGSTVILLFGPGAVDWTNALRAAHPVKMGQRIGTF